MDLVLGSPLKTFLSSAISFEELREEHRTVIKLLVDWGADIIEQDTNGMSFLLSFAKSGSISVARALLESGADVNLVTQYGESALHLCLSQENRRCCEYQFLNNQHFYTTE